MFHRYIAIQRCLLGKPLQERKLVGIFCMVYFPAMRSPGTRLPLSSSMIKQRFTPISANATIPPVSFYAILCHPRAIVIASLLHLLILLMRTVSSDNISIEYWHQYQSQQRQPMQRHYTIATPATQATHHSLAQHSGTGASLTAQRHSIGMAWAKGISLFCEERCHRGTPLPCPTGWLPTRKPLPP